MMSETVKPSSRTSTTSRWRGGEDAVLVDNQPFAESDPTITIEYSVSSISLT